MEEVKSDNTVLIEALNMIMPYGKYKGYKLLYLPEHYLVWYRQKGFPKGKLGKQMQLIYEIKLNGLETMMQKLIIK